MEIGGPLYLGYREKKINPLYEPSRINGLELSNRFVRSATWEGMATAEGAVTPKLIETMAALARGGVGLIITGHAYIRPEGQAAPLQLGIHKDELIQGLREMANAVHEAGGKMVIQLAHAGNFAAKQLTRQPPLVVSAFEGLGSSPGMELNKQDIWELTRAFADAAQRAKSAGFDGVQIHAAHGYLLSQFLSPAFNRRNDEYGGDLPNRVRIHLEILRAIRKVVGENYPILIKLNCRDFIENGMTLEDSLQAGKLLSDAGLDAIELSGGFITGGKLSPSRSGIDSEEREAYFQEEARLMKKVVNIPLILVGGVRSFGVAEKMVREGIADYISLSRPLIRVPNLINRWRTGDDRRSECRSDNLCFQPGLNGEGIYCVVNRRKEREELLEG